MRAGGGAFCQLSSWPSRAKGSKLSASRDSRPTMCGRSARASTPGAHGRAPGQASESDKRLANLRGVVDSFGPPVVLFVCPLPPLNTPPAASPPAVPPTTIAPPRSRPVVLPPPIAAAAAAAAPISLGGNGARPHTTSVLWPGGTCTDPPPGLVVLVTSTVPSYTETWVNRRQSLYFLRSSSLVVLGGWVLVEVSYSVPRAEATALGVCTSKFGVGDEVYETNERTRPENRLNLVWREFAATIC